MPMHLFATRDVRHRLSGFESEFFSEDNLHRQDVGYRLQARGSITLFEISFYSNIENFFL